jgi:membrane associated rhomboid family serine protease
MNPRAPGQNVWGWVTRPTAAFIWLFTAFFCFFVVQAIFQLAQSATVTTFNELFGLSIAGIQANRFWQLVSYGFLHQDILHLLLNGFLLYLVAYEVEDQIGIKNSILLFMSGIITGGLLWLGAEHFRSEHSNAILMGSSGGVYAMIFGFIMMFPERPIAILGGLRAKYIGIILTAIAFYFIVFPSSSVAHMAHLGGIFAGILFVKILSYQWRVDMPLYRRSQPNQSRRRERTVSRTEFINKKVDPILEKIAEHGMDSLSEEERRILDEAHHRLR